MPFNPNSLPPIVLAAYRQGPKFWPLVVQKAVQAGISDADYLASVVFYLHYPERNGRAIASHEKTMIDKWKAFRTTIKFQIPVNAPPKHIRLPKWGDLFNG